MKNSVAKHSALVMPSHYVELDEEEMSYIDGGDYYINHDTCVSIVGTLFASTYIGGVALGVGIMCGILSKATIAGFVYSIIGSVIAVNAIVGGLLAVVGKFAVEVVFNMICAVFSNKDGVVIETLKVWKFDTHIPMSVTTY